MGKDKAVSVSVRMGMKSESATKTSFRGCWTRAVLQDATKWEGDGREGG